MHYIQSTLHLVKKEGAIASFVDLSRRQWDGEYSVRLTGPLKHFSCRIFLTEFKVPHRENLFFVRKQLRGTKM